MAILSTGWSAGFTLLKEGGAGMSLGNDLPDCEIAACTSRAAPSISRLKLNCSVIEVLPGALFEVIESRPAMVENCFSRGKATEAAMVSAFAPGRPACTLMVGYSTLGRSLTGRAR